MTSSNLLRDNKNVFYQPLNDNVKAYENIRKTAKF